MVKTCDKCGKKLGIGKKKTPLKDEQGNKLVFCVDCYLNMPAVEKKRVEFKGEPLAEFQPVGLAFGVVGSFAYSEGAVKGFRWSALLSLKKAGFSKKQVDARSIDMFNVHFGALHQKGMQAVLDDFREKGKL